MNKRLMFCALLFLCTQHQLWSKVLPIPEPQRHALAYAAKNLDYELFDKTLRELEESGNVYDFHSYVGVHSGYSVFSSAFAVAEVIGAGLTVALGAYAYRDYSKGCVRVEEEWKPDSWDGEMCDKKKSEITSWYGADWYRGDWCELKLDSKQDILKGQKSFVHRHTFLGDLAELGAVVVGGITVATLVDHVRAWRYRSGVYIILKRLVDSPCCDEQTKDECRRILGCDDKN